MKTFGRIVVVAISLIALACVASATEKGDYKSGTVVSVTPNADAKQSPSGTDTPLTPNEKTYDIVINSEGTDYHCKLQSMYENLSWSVGQAVKFRIANKVLYLLNVNNKERPCDLQGQSAAK